MVTPCTTLAVLVEDVLSSGWDAADYSAQRGGNHREPYAAGYTIFIITSIGITVLPLFNYCITAFSEPA